MKEINPEKVKKIKIWLALDPPPSTRKIQELLKNDFSSGVNNNLIKKIRDELKNKITPENNKTDDEITGKLPPIVPNTPPKNPRGIPKILRKQFDLRDLTDEFQLYLVGLDAEKYTSNRKAIISRTQKFKRPSLIDGTVILMAQFLKFKKLKVIEK